MAQPSSFSPKPPKPFDLLAFDLFGVLITEPHLVSNGLMTLLPDTCSHQEVKRAYNAFNVGRISEADFWASIQGCLDKTADLSLIRSRFLDLFQLDPDYKTVITALGASYRLAILSNSPPDWADALTKKFAFKQHFKPCLFSGHCGCKKPQPEIYQQLIRDSGVNADRIVFIDDRRENLLTAHQYGMTTVQYWHEEDSNNYLPDRTIHQLADLVALFLHDQSQ